MQLVANGKHRPGDGFRAELREALHSSLLPQDICTEWIARPKQLGVPSKSGQLARNATMIKAEGSKTSGERAAND